MSATVVIDLGDDWSVAENEPADRRRPPARGLLVALVLAAVLLLAGGSAEPRPAFVELTDIPAEVTTAVDVGDGAIFIGVQKLGERTVARYPLRGGGAVWHTTVANAPESVEYLDGPKVVMVQSYDNENNQIRFTVLDAGTGQRLWSSTGDLAAQRLVSGQAGAVLVNQDENGAGTLRYTELRTGRTVWTRPFPALTQLVPTDSAGLVLGEADGTITLLAWDTGATLSTTRVGPLVAATDGYDREHNVIVSAVGDQLLIMRQMGLLQATISSYALPGLTERWSHTDRMSGYPSECGPVLCLQAFDGDLIALDPLTGNLLWRAVGWQSAWSAGDGRLLGSRQGVQESYGILDAATGRLVRDLGDWSPLTGLGTYLLMTKPDPGNYRYTWLGAVDMDRAVVRPLVRLEGLGTQGCGTYHDVDDILVCRTLDGKLKVWRYQE